MDDAVFSFAFIADPQIGMNSPFRIDGPSSDKRRLDLAVAYVNDNDIDFVIFGGDQIHDPGSEEWLYIFMRCVAGLRVPTYGVAGNHDQFDPRERESVYFQRGGPDNFAFTHKNAFFVGLNASKLRGDYGQDHQREEWATLRREFDRCPADCSQRFVVMHWPLFFRHPGEDDDCWNMPNRRQLIEFFGERRVSCVLSGHVHQDLDASWYGVGLVTSIGTSVAIHYPEELSFKVITVFKDGWLARRVSVERM